MGLVLDSGVLIAAECDARPVSDLLATLEREHGETEIVLSSNHSDRTGTRVASRPDCGPGPEAARVPGYCFRGDPDRTVHQGDGPACRKGGRPNLAIVEL
jgi:hypothetical protein